MRRQQYGKLVQRRILMSMVVQWLRIHLPMQRTWVQSLVWEDPTCWGNQARTPQVLKPLHPRAHALCQEKPLPSSDDPVQQINKQRRIWKKVHIDTQRNNSKVKQWSLISIQYCLMSYREMQLLSWRPSFLFHRSICISTNSLQVNRDFRETWL